MFVRTRPPCEPPRVIRGSAVVYGSTTDDVTNDPAIQFVAGVFAIA